MTADTQATRTPAGGSFTDDAWAATAGIRGAIDALPFLADLESGELSLQRFREYLAQDALYLGDYGRTLAACAAQATTSDDLVFWAQSAANTILVERQLHESWVAPELVGAMSPTCRAYTAYLSRLAMAGCYPVLVAGVLPCYWIYEDVGTRLKARVDLDEHPYHEWISLYGDPEFAQATEQAKAIADRLAAESSPQVVAAMHDAFATASRFEWMFWDAAYRLESWPV